MPTAARCLGFYCRWFELESGFCRSLNQMELMPDGLRIAALVLEWGRLSFVLGVFAFMLLLEQSRDTKLKQIVLPVLLAYVIAGRLGYALEHFNSISLELLDPRKGALSWYWGVAGALVVVLWKARVLLLAVASRALLAGLISFVPLLLKPVSDTAKPVLIVSSFQRLNSEGTLETVKFSDLKRPMLLNVWATWCGPCRSEMPLLVDAAKNGAQIVFVNANETSNAIQKYLQTENLQASSLLDDGSLQREFQVIGLPTTILIGKNSQILERKFGALDAATLADLLEKMKAQ
jgi:cytochrome c biogenesis protein CcmG, thiol:disulfide interchange protein DsbE